jgi:hypothetical protein
MGLCCRRLGIFAFSIKGQLFYLYHLTYHQLKMKKFLLALTIILSPVELSGQLQNEPGNQVPGQITHSFKDISISLSPNVLFNTPNGTQIAGGLKMRMFLGKRFSVDSELILGNDYTLAGPGLIGIPAWLLGFSFGDEEGGTFSDLFVAGLLILVTAEHTAYHIPLNNSMELSPYISLLRLKQTYKYGYYDHPDVTEDQACFGFGLEANKYFNKFVLSPYVEFNMGYTDHRPGINTGIYFGYYFPLGKK